MHDLFREICESLMILIFECIGTAMLACLYMSNTWWKGCDYGECGLYWTYVDTYDVDIGYQEWLDSYGDGAKGGTTYDGGFISFFLGFFILLIFSARISGSHYNPIVTLAFMFRK